MRIIFLDIDGVLNNVCTTEYYQGELGIDDENLKNFALLYEQSNKEEDTRVVLSSSWRIDKFNKAPNSYTYLEEKLTKYNIRIDSITPIEEISLKRGKEIVRWLNDHKDLNISSFIIIDDYYFRDFTTYSLLPALLKTSYKKGFTKKDINKALELLNTIKYEH